MQDELKKTYLDESVDMHLSIICERLTSLINVGIHRNTSYGSHSSYDKEHPVSRRISHVLNRINYSYILSIVETKLRD